MKKFLLFLFMLSQQRSYSQYFQKIDINTSTNKSSNPQKFTYGAGLMYFTASDDITAFTGGSSSELWRSDGTATGTRIVKDIYPGYTGYIGDVTVSIHGDLFFYASSIFNGMGLWKTNGTREGTVLLTPNTSNVNTNQLMKDVNGIIYFYLNTASKSALWKTDGTVSGTIPIMDNMFISAMCSVGNTLFFAAQATTGSTTGTELWKTDGTVAGTIMVKDIYTGPTSSNPSSLTNVNGTLFFTATDNTNGTELWKSDGTTTGTVMIKDIYSGSNSSAPASLTKVDATLFFTATNSANGTELWKSDGTASGTVLVKDLRTGNTSSALICLTEMNHNLYFYDANYGELYKTDGTSTGTILIKQIAVGRNFTDAALTNLNNTTLLFSGYSFPFYATSGVELWKTDGTEAGTVLVKDIYAGSNSSYPKYITSNGTNGVAFFQATSGDAQGIELWKTDGTEAGTVLVKDINTAYSSDAAPKYLTELNGTAYFMAKDGKYGWELWKSDGTQAGTLMLKDIDTRDSYSGLGQPFFTPIGSTLYFAATDSAHGTELWKTDGTSAGTVLVKDINTYSNGTAGSSPQSLTQLNGNLYFYANGYYSSNFHSGLWKSDGTDAGTVLVKEFTSSVQSITNVNGTLFFSVYSGSDAGLWKSDGTNAGTVLLKSTSNTINPIDYSRAAQGLYSFAVFNNAVYFRMENSNSELWKSDGTISGTVLVKNGFTSFISGNSKPGIAMATVYNNALYFAGTTTTNGTELWKTDGTTAGTVMVLDINSGSGDGVFTYNINSFFSNYYTFSSLNGQGLYFSADAGSTGTAGLWKTDGTSAGTVQVNSAPSLSTIYAFSNGIMYYNSGLLCRTAGTAACTSTYLSNYRNGDYGDINNVNNYNNISEVVYSSNSNKFYLIGYGGNTISGGALTKTLFSVRIGDLERKKLWAGAVNSVWSNAGNWCPSIFSTMPNNNNFDDVEISSGAVNMPVITDSTVAVNNLNLNGKSLTITNSSLNITGLLNNSWYYSGNSFITAIGASDITFSEPFAGGTEQYDYNIGSLTFSRNSTLRNLNFNKIGISSSLSVAGGNITGNINITNGGSVNASGITLKSNAAGTASVSSLADGSLYANSITIERYIPSLNRKKYTLVSSPVNSPNIYNAWQEGGINTNAGYGTQITGAAAGNGFDSKSVANVASIYTYNDANASGSKWVGLTNTSTNTLGAGKGYLLYVRGDRSVLPGSTSIGNTTLRATGTLASGTFTFNSASGLTTGANKYNLIANPYPSAIDWLSAGITKTQLTAFFTVYDPNLGVFVTSNGSVLSPAVATQQQARYIQSGQAFFIQNDATGTAPALAVTEAAKTTVATTTSSTTVFGSEATQPRLNLNIYSTNDSTFADGAVALFDNSYKPAVAKEDAGKLDNFTETFALRRNGQNLSIEGRPLVAGTDTLFFAMGNFSKKAYTLKIEGSNFSTGSAVLVDNYTNTKQPLDLAGTTAYGFTVNNEAASSANNRFMVVLGSVAINATTDAASVANMFVKLSPNPVKDKLQVGFKTASNKNAFIRIVNNLGQIVTTSNTKKATGTVSINVENLAAGIYTVQLISGDKQLAAQKIVKQ